MSIGVSDASGEMPAPERPWSDGVPRLQAARSHGERHGPTRDREETQHDPSIEMLV
jgi:hypothetical protein